MWEVILAMPRTLEKILNIIMEDLPLRNWCTAVTEDTCIRRLAMLAQNHISEEDFGNPVHLQSYLRHPSPEIRFLVLEGLCTVSESPKKARKIQVLLPDILGALQDTNTDMVLKALLVLRNVMAHVERREASGPALQLAEKLLPLFDHVSVLREPEPSAGPPVTRAALQPGPVGSTQAGPSQSPRQPRRWGALLGHGWCGWWRKVALGDFWPSA
ncbi:uncharacterized protein [Anas platyrhynchos]|uniref:uncharacterized protein n=1 Tax=Anas platyrhynchos TaxID=8839 RepID=UPI003AF2B69B